MGGIPNWPLAGTLWKNGCFSFTASNSATVTGSNAIKRLHMQSLTSMNDPVVCRNSLSAQLVNTSKLAATEIDSRIVDTNCIFNNCMFTSNVYCKSNVIASDIASSNATFQNVLSTNFSTNYFTCSNFASQSLSYSNLNTSNLYANKAYIGGTELGFGQGNNLNIGSTSVNNSGATFFASSNGVTKIFFSDSIATPTVYANDFCYFHNNEGLQDTYRFRASNATTLTMSATQNRSWVPTMEKELTLGTAPFHGVEGILLVNRSIMFNDGGGTASKMYMRHWLNDGAGDFHLVDSNSTPSFRTVYGYKRNAAQFNIPSCAVGVGTTNPIAPLHVAGNTYITSNVGIGKLPDNASFSLVTQSNCVLNNANIGEMGWTSTWAGFAHNLMASQLNYGLLQSSVGQTILNSAPGQTINLRSSNADMMEVGWNNILAKRTMRFQENATAEKNLTVNGQLLSFNTQLMNTTTASDVNVIGNLTCGTLEVTGTLSAAFDGGVKIGNSSTIKFYQTFQVQFTPTSNPYDVVISGGNGVNNFYPIVTILDYGTNTNDAFTTKIIAKSLNSFTVRVRRVDAANFGIAPTLQVFLMGHP